MELKVTSRMNEALSSMSAAGFHGAASVLNSGKQAVREEIQAKTSVKIKAIIKKMSNDNHISAEETDLIKTWIVGDAESYIHVENNLTDWVEEYKRLASALKDFENKNCDEKELMMLRGMLEDAIRISYDITNFLEKRERIKKFQLAVSDGLDKAEKKTLLSVLTHMLDSKDL